MPDFTFSYDFESKNIRYQKSSRTKSEIYEAIEPKINAREVEILDVPELHEQILTLILRGSKVDHEPNGHDDWANAALGSLLLASDGGGRPTWLVDSLPIHSGPASRNVKRIGAGMSFAVRRTPSCLNRM